MKFVNTALCVALLTATAPTFAMTLPEYHLARTIPVRGNGAWDYIVFDQNARRIYVPHGTRIEVLDADKGASIGVIQNTPGVHGIAVVKKLGQGFTTNGHAGTVSAVDLATFKHLAEIQAGGDPDTILFDPFTQRIIVSNGDSNDLTIIDPFTHRVIKTIPLGGAPEYSASDGAGRVWVNVRTKNAVVQIDPRALRVVRTIPLDDCSEPTSMAFDAHSKRLFLGCRNRVLAVVNVDSGNQVARLHVGLHVDGTIFDPASHLLFVSSGEGFISVFHQDSPDQYSAMQQIETIRGAKTMALDRKTGTLYLPTMSKVPAPSFGPPRASGPLAYAPSPFEVLVVQKTGDAAQIHQ